MSQTQAAEIGTMVKVQEEYLLQTPWGWATITEELLEDLASFTGKSRSDCLERLRTYDYGQMAKAWKDHPPQTPEEMRAFYGATDAYVWSLSLWHATSAYDFYRGLVKQMAERQGKRQGRRALDYGSGVGTTALQLAELGYEVTLADVPGITFNFAQHRLRRRGFPFKVIPITTEYPPLEGIYDAIVCFDVLEHVPHPDRVFLHMVKFLAPAGYISVIAPFEAQSDQEGYHLRENYLRWGNGRWALFLSACGFKSLGFFWQRDTSTHHMARLLHYRLWRLTGLDIRYKSRVIRA